MPIRMHEDSPDDLREAIRFTAEETGFAARMIEKDYFCSVVLEALSDADGPLVFKGGTCLAKVHTGFFRMSEDLDFSISTKPDATQSDRRQAIAPVRVALRELPSRVPGLEVQAPLTGHNSSRQYIATLAYRSLLAPRIETIEIEVGLREPVLTPLHRGAVRTVLLHWVRGEPFLDPFQTSSLSYREAMAEKLRAALSRREPAIRDFFDIDHAVSTTGFDFTEAGVLQLVRDKLAVSGTSETDVSHERLSSLRSQLHSRLRPVLRGQDFDRFDLDRAFAIVRGAAAAL